MKTEQKPAHSPLPWSVKPHSRFIRGSDGRILTETITTELIGNIAAENAALIVRAVNAHETLVKEVRALTFALESIVMLRGHALGPDGLREVVAYLEHAKTTVAEVTGEPGDAH